MLDQALIKTFQHIGFSEKEARVYIALLELGRGTATEIADRAEIKRAIVYHVIDHLKELGYAQDVHGGNVKRFSASEPSKVLFNVRTAVDDLRFMLPVLRAMQDKGRARPRIEFFEGKEAVVSVYRTYEQGKDVRFLTSMKRLSHIMPEEIQAWVTRYQKKKMHVSAKHFITDTPVDRTWAKGALKAGQAVRLLPRTTKIEMDFAIVDDQIGITSFDPLFIVVIHSEQIARSVAKLFDLAWMQGKPMRVTRLTKD